MAESDGSFWSRWEMMLLLFIVIVSLVIAGGYASYVIISTSHGTADATPVAASGDTVTVNYIGMFEDGTVFDTSLQSVAENNTLYPKSLSFSSKYDYSPLNFTIGSGSMIKGFENGVIGMALNQTKLIVISPEDGYGEADESLIETRSIQETVPVYEWFGNATEFEYEYGVEAEIGTIVKSADYGWNVTVFYVDPLTGQVQLRNDPFLGEIINPRNTWSSKVVSIDSTANVGVGEIVIRHLLSSEDIKSELYADATGAEFLITAVDLDAGTYTVDYNREVVGKTLVFKVTLVTLAPGQ